MNKKLTIASVIAAIVVMPTFAVDGDKRTTSQPYVEAQIETTQIKIPAANPSNTNYGERVVTYTNVSGGGVIGERELFTGGEYDADSDSGKLITAGALNNTFTNLPTTDTTKLVCANQSDGCTLWTITDQTAYGVSGSGSIDLEYLDLLFNSNSWNSTCYKSLDGNHAISACEEQSSMYPLSSLNYGGWSNSVISNEIYYTYHEWRAVRGISTCSTLRGGTEGEVASNQAQVQADYERNMQNAPISDGPIREDDPTIYCYCKLTDPSPAEARWVYYDDMNRGGNSYCPSECAEACSNIFNKNPPTPGTVHYRLRMNLLGLD